MTLRTVGEVPAYDFPVRDHLEIGEALGAIDMERGAKVSGARFYFLTGPGALLEFALAQLAITRAVAAGFTPVVAPALVRPEAMEGTGFLGEHDEEVYRIERDDLYLVGTSEVALAGMHIERGARPVRRARAATPAGRPASAARPAPTARTPAASSACTGSTRSRCSASAGPRRPRPSTCGCCSGRRSSSQALELPYRVVDIAAGDLGTSATRKYDIEAWFPSQGTYRELTSTSDCTTFQARRLNIRYRDEDGQAADGGHAQRHALRDRPHHRLPARGAPARRRLGARAGRAASVAGRHRGAHARDDARRAGAAGVTAPPRRAAGGLRRRCPGADEVVELGRPRAVAAQAGGHRPRRHAARRRRRGHARAPGRRWSACWDAGIPVVGVTGRGPRLLDSVRVALDGRGIAVLAQGGYVVDLERDEVLRTVGAAPGAGDARWSRRSRRSAGDGDPGRRGRRRAGARCARPLRVQHGFDWPYPEPAHLLPRNEVLPPGAVLKVFLRSATLGQDELLARAQARRRPGRRRGDPRRAGLHRGAAAGDHQGHRAGRWRWTGTASGFADVLVFGDMPNDLPMIGAVRRRGRPRGGRRQRAPRRCGRRRRSVTSGHDADGVARYLEALCCGRDV